MPAKNVAYIEGESTAQDLIYALADEITGAAWNANDGTAVVNRWEEVYRQDPTKWVTYKVNTRPNILAVYKHSNGLNYPVYAPQASYGSDLNMPDVDGFVQERVGSSSNATTGKRLKVKGTVEYNKEGVGVVTADIVGMLLANTPDGVAILAQGRKNLTDNGFTLDAGWNEFELQGYLTPEQGGDYADFLNDSDGWPVYYQGSPYYDQMQIVRSQYKFTERFYETDPTHIAEKTVVLKSVPDNVDGSVSPDVYYVMFKQPESQYNYVDVIYGQNFTGTNATGDPTESYIRACNLVTVKTGTAPTVINQKEAHAAYERQTNNSFIPATEQWKIDVDGVTEIKSPPSHFFFGADSVVTWLTNKKRRGDYFVSYYLSVSNSRLGIVLEGDPAPDLDGYYRSFAYIGRITPFNSTDNRNNFAMTVGMGDLADNKTGMVIADIAQDKNPVYSKWGQHTSNGMYSVSMFATRANVFFQAHYPAFITQLPNYPSVGTLPTQLSRLVLERTGYQMSQWTDRYHGSPIYLAHPYEGYRGFMDGVIAINDHNLINMDELIVDTEEPKPGGGTWTEVYKFFSLKSPTTMFDMSANPDGMTVAILKEVK